MLRFFKDLLKGKVREPEPIKEPVAPYKVETPVAQEPAPVATTNLVVDGHGDVHEVKAETKPKKAPAKKQQFAKKPAAMKASTKPKTPRKPKATK